MGRVQKSIFGRISLIFNHSFDVSWHALHQSSMLLLGDFMPLCFIWWLVTINLPLHLVWRLGCPWHGHDLVVFYPHFDWPGCVTWSIVLLKNPILRVRGAEGSKPCSYPCKCVDLCILYNQKSTPFQPCWHIPEKAIKFLRKPKRFKR